MEPIDYTNPNLDGDFKTLYKLLQTRKPETDFGEYLSLDSNANSTIDINISSNLAAVPPSAPTRPPSNDTQPLYDKLLTAINNNDVAATQLALEDIASKGFNLSQSEFRDPESNATVLHTALMGGHMQVARHLIRVLDPASITLEYDIVVGNVHSSKTCLHILADYDNVQLTKLVLDQLPPGPKTLKFLQKTVLSELEGQRPRHLAVIHIAALRGNIPLVELLVGCGVDVNSKNNKNDTPILWASRGNHIKAVQRLIELGADVHWQNDKGSSPLYWAVRYGFSDLVQVLIQEGHADVNQRRALGLVAPVVLASALGCTRILTMLIENGADPNTRITDDQTPLQHAASNGEVGSIEILLQHDVIMDATDESGNTALMYAAKNNRLKAVCVLVQNGANLNCKNKSGQTVWDFAVDSPNDALLTALITLYRKRCRMADKKFILPAGRTPLHVAAQKGDVGKIKCLFQLGVDARTVDNSGNTYFHVAARHNRVQVLDIFLTDVDINLQNGDGETALHLAVKSGHLESVQMLVKKAKMEMRDKAGYTALHVAVRTKAASFELVSLLVQTMINTTNWSLVNAQDSRGNTALHLACRKGRYDVIPALQALQPMKANHDGDTPFHVAAQSGIGATLQMLLDVFNQPGKGLYIDTRNKDGDTALHICAKLGDHDQVQMLVKCGSDLAAQNALGNTVLHELIRQSALDKVLKEDHLFVYNTIVDTATRWWCIQRDLHIPDEDSEVHLDYHRAALVHLTSNVINDVGVDVLRYAVLEGAYDLLAAILNTPNVYCFQAQHEVLFDVTNIAPRTLALKYKEFSRKDSSNRSSVGVLRGGEDEKYTKASTQSCLDLIVSMDDEVQATLILDLIPIRQMISNLWKAYQWIYGLLIVLHIVYMSCYTAYSIPVLTTFYNNTANGVLNPRPDPMPLGLFLIWPIILLVFHLYYITVNIYHWCHGDSLKSDGGRDIHEKDDRKFDWNLFSLLQRGMNIIFTYLSSIASLGFSCLTICWYVLYCLADSHQVYIVPVVLILGWLFTISFTKGFETVHAFSIMLKYIIVRDITRFLLIYMFVLLGFAFALHALFQLSPGLSGSAWDSLFASFNLMLGLGSVFDEDFNDVYQASGGSTLYVEIVYLIYISLSTIILLNLLIAMMSDTYTQIKAREGTTWRVGSVRLALALERSLPFLNRFFSAVGIIKLPLQWNPDVERWLMTVSVKELHSKRAVQVDEALQSIRRLESRVAKLQAAHHDLVSSFDRQMSKSGQLTGDRFANAARKMSLVKRRPAMTRMGSTLTQGK